MKGITTPQSVAGDSGSALPSGVRPSGIRTPAEASQEFESVLLGQWLQAAEASFGSVPGNEDDDVGSSQIKEFATQHLAAVIAKSGGIGIAKIVESALIGSAGINQRTADNPKLAGTQGDRQ